MTAANFITKSSLLLPKIKVAGRLKLMPDIGNLP
jgi:hypothetical protein